MNITRDVAVIVGSLRQASFNLKMARALMEMAPASLKFDIVPIGQLPLYNPDTDKESPLPEWTAFRSRIKSADALLFFTPEHNRSMPAAMKNAVDVGSRPPRENAWGGKPGAVISVSDGGYGGFGANHHLRQTLMSVNVAVMPQPEAYLGLAKELFDAEGKLIAEKTRALLERFLARFVVWIEANRAG